MRVVATLYEAMALAVALIVSIIYVAWTLAMMFVVGVIAFCLIGGIVSVILDYI